MNNLHRVHSMRSMEDGQCLHTQLGTPVSPPVTGGRLVHVVHVVHVLLLMLTGENSRLISLVPLGQPGESRDPLIRDECQSAGFGLVHVVRASGLVDMARPSTAAFNVIIWSRYVRRQTMDGNTLYSTTFLDDTSNKPVMSALCSQQLCPLSGQGCRSSRDLHTWH